jgi:hypothetical protein
MRNKTPRAKFKVGDRVRFDHFKYPYLRGTIVEDRGPLGVDGRRLYVVSKPSDPFDPELRTISEDRLELDRTPPAPLEKAEIIQFLENGGLIWILMSNPSGEGRTDPRVWLCRDQLGGVVFTFASERGQVGGAPVPFAAFWDSAHIRAEKRDEVAAYLLTFGLTPGEADEVIQAVGVAPVKKPRRRKAETA